MLFCVFCISIALVSDCLKHGADKANGCEKKEQPSRTSIDLELERETARMKQVGVVMIELFSTTPD